MENKYTQVSLSFATEREWELEEASPTGPKKNAAYPPKVCCQSYRGKAY